MSLRNLTQVIAGLAFIALPLPSWAGQAPPAASPFKGEYFITRNADDICVSYTRNLNQFRRLEFDVCDPRLSGKYPEFTRPVWEEIPFDLSVAEMIIRNVAARGQGDPFWAGWLKASEPLRQGGKITLSRTRIDIDWDGAPETILRLYAPLKREVQQGRVQWVIDHSPCIHRNSTLYLVESPNDIMKEDFNNKAFALADIIIRHSEGHDKSYALDRSMSPGLDGLNIGATRELTVYVLFNLGAGRACSIDWVPTGHYRPLKRPRTSR
jgi:hypothetical protein